MRHLHAFDMHGTLVEGNEDAIVVILGRIIKNPRTIPTKEIIASMMGLPIEDMIRFFIAEATKEKVGGLVKKFREVSQEVTPRYLRQKEGARNLLSKLKDQQDVIAIVTTANTTMATKMLEWVDLRPFCDYIFGNISGDVATGKADHIQKIIQKIAPLKTYMVGDTVEDMEAGRKVGAITVLIRSSANSANVPQADFEIRNLEDYFELISKEA